MQESEKGTFYKVIEKLDSWLGPGKLKYKPACYDLKDMFIECVIESDCMKQHNNNFQFCATQGVNQECKAIRHDWYLCRKSQVDWTKHFSKDDPR
ncbi:hypothetical protein pb186bvf_015504 [Paramecium bursaria]